MAHKLRKPKSAPPLTESGVLAGMGEGAAARDSQDVPTR